MKFKSLIIAFGVLLLGSLGAQASSSELVLRQASDYAILRQAQDERSREWILPENIDVPTVFFPGMGCCFFTQIARYTGPEGFITPLGEHVYCTRGIHTIKNPCLIDAESDEIEHQKPIQSWLALWNPFMAFNVIWKNYYFTITSLDRLKYGVKVENVSNRESVRGHYSPFSATNFAQHRDIQNHKRKYDACTKAHPETPKILYGVSRGAATTFRACALHGHTYDDVRLVILEGCFDNVPHNLKARFPMVCAVPGLYTLCHDLLSKVTCYKKDGGSPLDDVERFPKHLPVAFIASEADRVVPSECTKDLVQALVNAGHQEVYFLRLKASSHSKYMMDNPQDAADYQHFIHALYKKYNLPYIEEYANQGQSLLESCRVLPPQA
jgi:hypothetical protein